LFFNTNINVCNDWISRIRYKVIMLFGCLVIRYS
jgi:hypothetical protein